MFALVCVVAFVVSFAGSAIVKVTYTSPELRKYSAWWSDGSHRYGVWNVR